MITSRRNPRSILEIYDSMSMHSQTILQKGRAVNDQGTLVRSDEYRDVSARVFDYAAEMLEGGSAARPAVARNMTTHVSLMEDAEEASQVFSSLRRDVSNSAINRKDMLAGELRVDSGVLRVLRR